MYPERSRTKTSGTAPKSPKLSTEFKVDEFSNAYPDGIENDFWNIARKKTINYYVKKYGLDDILDIGCGRGIVTHYLRTMGSTITGVELGICDPVAKDVLVYYDKNATQLPESVRLRTRTILLLDVIEHIKNPEAFLENLLTYFPNATHLLITVPARKELWSNYDDFYGHFRRYDLDMIEKTVNTVGFKVKIKKYFFHALYPILLFQNYFDKDRKIKLSAPKGLWALFIHKVIGLAFYFDAVISPQKLKGSSVLCLAELK